MLIRPQKRYRVCCNCGKILKAGQLVTVVVGGKPKKCCPFCGVGEEDGADKMVLTEYQAKNLFRVAKMASAETFSTEETHMKYTALYDAYGIPKKYRLF